MIQLNEEINLTELYKKPYMAIPFSIGKKQIREAMDAFFAFLELPMETKQYMDSKISPLHRRGDLGFKHRDPEEDIYNDRKDFFHYHPILEDQYADFIHQNPVVHDFLKQADPIWHAVYQSVKNVLSHFEADYPGTLVKVFETQTPHIVLRFLRYDYAKSGAYLAKPHFDAGSFTLAIGESSPGLRIGTNPEDLELVTQEDNKAIFMISSNVQKIIETDKLSPGWHDVIQLDTAMIHKPFSRWAMVAFIDGHTVEALSRQETHKFDLDNLRVPV